MASWYRRTFQRNSRRCATYTLRDAVYTASHDGHHFVLRNLHMGTIFARTVRYFFRNAVTLNDTEHAQ